MKYYVSVLFVIGIVNIMIGQISSGIEKVGQSDIAPSGNYNDIWNYEDGQGNEYAIIGSRQRVNIYDITQCDDPVLDTFYVDGANTTWRDFKTYQNYVYGVCDQCNSSNVGLQVIDMNTGVINNYDNQFKSAHNIFIEENTGRLYAVGVNGSQDLIIYDLAANPANPVHLATIDFGSGKPNYIHDIFVRGYIAYASHGYSGYAIYDVTNPTSIIDLAFYTGTTGYNHSSWADDTGEYVYVAYEVPTGVPIDILKIDSTGGSWSIQKKGSFQFPLLSGATTGNRPHNPFVKGDSLYISYYHDGLQVLDITNKENPELVAYYDTESNHSSYSGYTGLWGTYPYSSRGCITGSDLNNGLFTFELFREEVRTENASIILNNLTQHLVFTDANGQQELIYCDINGNLIQSAYTGQPTTEAILKNTDMYLPQLETDIIFKTGDQGKFRYYKLAVDASNNLTTVQIIPTGPTIESDGPLIFDQYSCGIIMRNTDEKRVQVKLNASGTLSALDWNPGMN